MAARIAADARYPNEKECRAVDRLTLRKLVKVHQGYDGRHEISSTTFESVSF